MDLTLKERLRHANISTERACQLFGRTERTLWSWNKKPPAHVLEVIKLHCSRHRMPKDWENWFFDRHWLVDPTGNAFHINDVKNLWIERQLAQSLHGSTTDVYSLKLELEKKIRAINSKITITVNVGNKAHDFNIAL